MTWAAHILLALLSLIATGSPQGGPHERDRGVDVTLHELRVDAEHPHAVHPTKLAVPNAIALPQHAVNAAVDLDDELEGRHVEVADERPERMLPPHPHPELLTRQVPPQERLARGGSLAHRASERDERKQRRGLGCVHARPQRKFHDNASRSPRPPEALAGNFRARACTHPRPRSDRSFLSFDRGRAPPKRPATSARAPLGSHLRASAPRRTHLRFMTAFFQTPSAERSDGREGARTRGASPLGRAAFRRGGEASTSAGSSTLAYNGRGRLISVTHPTVNNTTNAEYYAYDSQMRRIGRFGTVNGAASTTDYEYFVWDGANLVASIDKTNAVHDSWLFEGVDQPLRISTSGLQYYYELDLAGNVRRLRRTDGSDGGGYRYSAFGQEYAHDTQAPTPAIDQPLRWKARQWSDFGQLYDVRARWWSPQLGVFTAIDRFAHHDGRSTLWGWAHQGPTRWRDTTGLMGLPVTPLPAPPPGPSLYLVPAASNDAVVSLGGAAANDVTAAAAGGGAIEAVGAGGIAVAYGALGAWFYIDVTSGPAADEGPDEGGAPDPFEASKTHRWILSATRVGRSTVSYPCSIEGWDLGQLEEAAFELCESIRERERDAEAHGGYDRNHAKRVLDETQLLKRIQDAIHSFEGVE